MAVLTQPNLFGIEKMTIPSGPFSPECELRALSWKQPYLHLMFNGKIETRTWPTKYRGWVMMCASQTSYKLESILNISGEAQFRRIGATLAGKEAEIYDLRGRALAIGFLADCRPMDKADEDQCFVEYNPELYCHVYTNVQRIDPVSWKGSQGWRQVPADVKSKIIIA